MLPSRFEYHRPDSLEEAMHLLAEHGDEAKVLAGGQSLIPVMKLRLAAPAHLVDIGRLGLDSIAEADGHLAIGALARHRDLERSDLVKARYPVMAAAAPLISDPIVRNLGTIGGSLC
ncbi:MAG: FAD binding domain-containing protein, partial [Actinomycetota bacterium]